MRVSRRQFVTSAAALAGCGRKLARPFNGFAFVANQEGRTISAVSLARFKVTRQILLDSAPSAVLNIPGTRRVLALTPENATVLEIDGGELSVTRSKRVGGRALSMRLAPDGESLWVLCRDPQALVQLDLKLWRAGTTVRLPQAARDFDLSATAPLAVVGAPAFLVNLATGKLERPIEIEGDGAIIRFRPDGKQVLAGDADARIISVADLATGRLLAKLPLAFSPERFCFTPDNGGQLFVSGRGMDAIAIVSPYQVVVEQTVLAGRAPGNMTVDSGMTYLYVTNPESGDLTVIAIQDRRTVARIAVGQQPNHVLITPDGQFALILNEKSGDMAVVRVSKLTDDFRFKPPPLFTVVATGGKPVSAAICAL